MQASIALNPHPTGAVAARQFVVGALQRAGRQDLTDTAALLSSELVTNVVLHARSDMIVEVDLDDTRLRVSVIDSSDEPARRRETTTLLEEHGRGLQIVDALATSWGVNAGPRGKAVWFELGSGRP
jgi:anti-sigma regulatory factor (Ser/Thr protein kinase)